MIKPTGRRLALGFALTVLLVAVAVDGTRRSPREPAAAAGSGASTTAFDTTGIGRVPTYRLAGAGVVIQSENAVDGRLSLDITVSAMLLRNGGVAAFLPSRQRILVFDSTGAYLTTIGRPGRGPGEFAGASSMARGRGDTLLVLDHINARLTWLTIDGTIVRAVPLDGRIPLLVGLVVGELPDGRVVLSNGGAFVGQSRTGPLEQPVVPVIVFDPTGSAKTVATLPSIELTRIKSHFLGRPDLMTDYVRLGRKPSIALLDTAIVTGSGMTYEVTFRNPNGQPLHAIALHRPRRPVTASIRQASVEAELARLRRFQMEKPVDPDETERVVRIAVYADSMPAFVGLFATDDRTLWILEPLAAIDSVWSAVAFKDGRFIARLVGPADAVPIAFGDDRVLVRKADDDGVVTLEIRRILH